VRGRPQRGSAPAGIWCVVVFLCVCSVCFCVFLCVFVCFCGLVVGYGQGQKCRCCTKRQTRLRTAAAHATHPQHQLQPARCSCCGRDNHIQAVAATRHQGAFSTRLKLSSFGGVIVQIEVWVEQRLRAPINHSTLPTPQPRPAKSINQPDQHTAT